MALRMIALLACLAASSAQAQETIDIPNAQARVIAMRAVQAGDVQLAYAIAEQLLAQDPNDRTALLVMAAAAPQVGNFAAGRRAGARAWRVSETGAQKYEAARLTALAAAGEERFTLSTIWLRRALTVAPNEAETNRTIMDARAISQRNPWATSLSFSVVPSNNLNGGADDPVLSAPGNPDGTLSDDAMALAGLRASLNFSTQYRLHGNANSRTTLGLQYSGARVRLQDDAPVPDAAFATDTTVVSLAHDRILPKGSLSITAAAGASNYAEATSGGQDVAFQRYDILRFGLNYRQPLSDRSELGISVQSERLNYETVAIDTVDRTTLTASYGQHLLSGDNWHASVSFTDSDSPAANYVSETLTLQGGYRWKDPIGPVTLALSAGATWADYPDYRLLFPVTGGRQDTTLFYNVNMGFADLSYAGFTPGVAINHSFAESNVSRFTRETVSVGFTLTSQF